jgi:hypothetical protein
MRSQWIASEHHRLHTVECWPDSPYKEATLRAIRAAIASLTGDSSMPACVPLCEVCLNRRRITTVLRFPGDEQADLAA